MTSSIVYWWLFLSKPWIGNRFCFIRQYHARLNICKYNVCNIYIYIHVYHDYIICHGDISMCHLYIYIIIIWTYLQDRAQYFPCCLIASKLFGGWGHEQIPLWCRCNMWTLEWRTGVDSGTGTGRSERGNWLSWLEISIVMEVPQNRWFIVEHMENLTIHMTIENIDGLVLFLT